jgi:outer membrane protein assembly factor BamD (BamD/ComL family)
MTDREERLEEALLRIKQWAEAYPVTAFAPLTKEQIRYAGALLKERDIDIGALHAEWGRHILKGIGEVCDGALARPDGVKP